MDMRENGTPLSRVAFFGLVVGTVGGFLISLLYMWFDTEAGQDFVFRWPIAVSFTVGMGLMTAVVAVSSMRSHRKKAARTASGSTERATGLEQQPSGQSR
ncbi:hypothetical protein AB0F88_31355 [Streptosporangium sp. NPDC023963]|uniref:hypothetical protein n=1 Tax=Streptosporangium sp. NPDC023963 TaxID=3155608 RepID=UPI0034153CEE